MLTVAGDEFSEPSLAAYSNESVPVKPADGVY